MAKAKRVKNEPIEIEAGSGNVFEDLGLPDAGERLAKAERARAIRTIVKEKKSSRRERTVADLISENRE